MDSDLGLAGVPEQYRAEVAQQLEVGLCMEYKGSFGERNGGPYIKSSFVYGL